MRAPKVDFGDHARSILVGMKKERQNPKGEIEVSRPRALLISNLARQPERCLIFDIGYADKVIPLLALPEKPAPNETRAG